PDEQIEFVFIVYATKKTKKCRINLTVFSNTGNPIGSISNHDFFSINENEYKKVHLILKDHHLTTGIYNLSFSIGTGSYLNSEVNFEVIPHFISFEIISAMKFSQHNISQWRNGWGNIIFESMMFED
ncbi:MAG: Wzt carbohydrate-binding domain-containing protein, partial [Clostridia bacterium]|nr:Wzt carbohydrate-binding domain-containing protein [Clostridia bacterium]